MKLSKKGDVTNCKNWRGITLLSVPNKILSRITLNWVKICIEKKTPERAGQLSKQKIMHRPDKYMTYYHTTKHIANLYLLYVDFIYHGILLLLSRLMKDIHVRLYMRASLQTIYQSCQE
jgi:hypothetical protein